MHDEHLARGEIGDEVFGAADETLDARAHEPPREIVGQRPTQILAVRLDRDEPGALHRRGKAPPHRLDLGQLRHVYSVGRFPGI